MRNERVVWSARAARRKSSVHTDAEKDVAEGGGGNGDVNDKSDAMHLPMGSSTKPEIEAKVLINCAPL